MGHAKQNGNIFLYQEKITSHLMPIVIRFINTSNIKTKIPVTKTLFRLEMLQPLRKINEYLVLSTQFTKTAYKEAFP